MDQTIKQYICRHTYLGTFIGVLMVLTLQRVKIGPWGGTGGHAWDEGGHGASAGSYTGVRRMSIGSSWCVSSMLFEYDDNGKRVKGTLHGERDNGIPEEELDFHGEVLTHMCGYHDNHLIRWLQFRSNRNRTFGPYGNLGEDQAGWTRFEVSMEHSGSIVGFCGRSDNFVDAIGVYVAVWNPERFYDSMSRHGVRVYRASPLRMDLRQIEEEKKKEEVERGRLQKEIEEGRESLRNLRLKLRVDVPQDQRKRQTRRELQVEQQKIELQLQELQQLARGRQEKRQTLEELQVEQQEIERQLQEMLQLVRGRQLEEMQQMVRGRYAEEEEIQQMVWAHPDSRYGDMRDVLHRRLLPQISDTLKSVVGSSLFAPS
uniref:Jacalin-type lectin domain-containing protein n=1 Tax=Oryza glumipatula TaxID=40148 RepID=A0A0D9ZHE9_9ORYZ